MKEVREYDIGPLDGPLLAKIYEHFTWEPIPGEAIQGLMEHGWAGRLVITVDEKNHAIAMGIRA